MGKLQKNSKNIILLLRKSGLNSKNLIKNIKTSKCGHIKIMLKGYIKGCY